MVCGSIQVEASLLQYTKTARDPLFGSSLVMSNWYDLFPVDDGNGGKPHKWPQNFPNAGKPGVYLVFDDSELLLYVGKSETDVQSRLGRYFGYETGRTGPCKIKSISPPWKVRPHFVRTIAVKDSKEAPLLEEFLIDVLQPPENTRGIRRPKHP